jgi:hypothetical protein
MIGNGIARLVASLASALEDQEDAAQEALEFTAIALAAVLVGLVLVLSCLAHRCRRRRYSRLLNVPEALVVSGEFQHRSKATGTYKLVAGRKVCGRPVWKHAHENLYLAHMPAFGWAFQSECDLGRKNAHALQCDVGVADPTSSDFKWAEWDRSTKAWVPVSISINSTASLPKTAFAAENVVSL